MEREGYVTKETGICRLCDREECVEGDEWPEKSGSLDGGPTTGGLGEGLPWGV